MQSVCGRDVLMVCGKCEPLPGKTTYRLRSDKRASMRRLQEGARLFFMPLFMICTVWCRLRFVPRIQSQLVPAARPLEWFRTFSALCRAVEGVGEDRCD